jgi:hypothetical protein
MLFTARQSEQNEINKIHEVNSTDYTLVRMTPTMMEKNNIDANGIFRDMLENADIVDYDLLKHGGENGINVQASFIKDDGIEPVKLKFYKVANRRGDRRFSIETIKKKMKDGVINEGDLIYFSLYHDANAEAHVFMINLTHGTPSKNQLIDVIGRDEIMSKFEEIKPRLKEIVNGGWYANSKGVGKKDPKDVGDTLESLLTIKTNNSKGADIGGLIEIKSKGTNNTKDTLFTLKPCFEGTPVAKYEPNDRNRVSAFERLYGYESDRHPNSNNLYITIGSQDAPQNNQGFYLDVDDEKNIVRLNKVNEKTKTSELMAFWKFADLKKRLEVKHPSTLWVSAEEKENDGMTMFKYSEIEFSRSPQFMTFLSLIKTGDITYDWRGYTSKQGAYIGKNHGNAWRIKPKARKDLFGEIVKLDI